MAPKEAPSSSILETGRLRFTGKVTDSFPSQPASQRCLRRETAAINLHTVDNSLRERKNEEANRDKLHHLLIYFSHGWTQLGILLPTSKKRSSITRRITNNNKQFSKGTFALAQREGVGNHPLAVDIH